MQENPVPLRPRSRADLCDAIAYLASACDGARRRDGHGFNADDVSDGHRLARTNRWSRRDRRRARQLVRYYRRQLTTAGFDVDALLSGRRPRRRSRRFRRENPPQWAADPTGVHTFRYWSGARWTHLVAQDSVVVQENGRCTQLTNYPIEAGRQPASTRQSRSVAVRTRRL